MVAVVDGGEWQAVCSGIDRGVCVCVCVRRLNEAICRAQTLTIAQLRGCHCCSREPDQTTGSCTCRATAGPKALPLTSEQFLHLLHLFGWKCTTENPGTI